jgi:CheY-like chemotaxis protein
VDGETVGTLCAYDVKPHEVPKEALDNLRTMANAAVFHLGGRIHPATVPPGPGMRVVLLDDNPDSAQALAELLALLRPELRTEVQEDWTGAIASIVQARPISVIADLKRDPLESLTSTRAIRAALGQRAPQLIAVTGDVFGVEALCCNDGFDHALVKPMKIGALLNVLPEGSVKATD